MKIGFSLDSVERVHQEPNRNKRESKYYWEEVYELISGAGFSGIEMPYEKKWIYSGRTGVPLAKQTVLIKYGSVKAYLDCLSKKGISKIAGLYVSPAPFATGTNDALAHSRSLGQYGNVKDSDSIMGPYFNAFGQYAKEALQYAAELGCEYIAITLTPPVGLIGNMLEDEAAFLSRTAELINTLAEEAGSLKLCIKNDYWSLLRGEKVHDFIQGLHQNVYYCVDTASLAIAGADPVKFIRSCGDRIGCVTLTDTAFVDDGEYYKEPKPEFPSGKPTQVFRDMGKGSLDFDEIFKALNDAGFDGWAIVNNRQTRDICRTMLHAKYLVGAIEGGRR